MKLVVRLSDHYDLIPFPKYRKSLESIRVASGIVSRDARKRGLVSTLIDGEVNTKTGEKYICGAIHLPSEDPEENGEVVGIWYTTD